MKKIKKNKSNSNFLKKWLIKINRKLGFELIDQSNLTFSTRENTEEQSVTEINKKIITLPLGEIEIKNKVKSLLIIFRSFTNENKLLSQNKKRIFEEEKKEYTLRSLRSICRNISSFNKKFDELKTYLKIIDDKSDKSIIDQFNNICSKEKIIYDIEKLDIDKYSEKLNFKDNPRMISHNCHIMQSKNFALKEDYDLIYFVEDDYIHTENAIEEMVCSYQKFSSQTEDDIILCPSDYPYLYQKYETTRILMGHKKHWRQVGESLCTYLLSKNTLKKFWNYYEDMFLNNYDPYEKPLHDLYKKVFCFSPMPSIAIHLTNINSIYGLSPQIDWKKLWDENK